MERPRTDQPRTRAESGGDARLDLLRCLPTAGSSLDNAARVSVAGTREWLHGCGLPKTMPARRKLVDDRFPVVAMAVADLSLPEFRPARIDDGGLSRVGGG